MTAIAGAPPAVDLPAAMVAHEPPEARGMRRDGVRLMVSSENQAPRHAGFTDVPHFLAAGDLVVVNTSATVPAAVDARAPDGTVLRVHVSTRLPADLWLVELRRPTGASSTPYAGDVQGAILTLSGGGTVALLHRYMNSTRLWLAALNLPEPLPGYLARWGRPIRYAYVTQEWPIETYQTVYATEPGSAEMPSAGRPFSAEVMTALVARGIGVTPLLLHTGVSSLEGDEQPYPEPFSVPDHTAWRVNQTRAHGGRVIAVGTTVVRALESAADGTGVVHPAAGWADLVITPERGVSAVDGLLTGFHEPRASHIQMLEAIAGRTTIDEAYAAARNHGYRWHEFGDSHLILPDPAHRP